MLQKAQWASNRGVGAYLGQAGAAQGGWSWLWGEAQELQSPCWRSGLEEVARRCPGTPGATLFLFFLPPFHIGRPNRLLSALLAAESDVPSVSCTLLGTAG